MLPALLILIADHPRDEVGDQWRMVIQDGKGRYGTRQGGQAYLLVKER